MTIAEYIKQIRKEYGITQSQLASFFGVNLRTVQNWEAGRPVPESVKKYLTDGTLLSVFSQPIEKPERAEEEPEEPAQPEAIQELKRQLDMKDSQILHLMNIIDKLIKD